MIAHTLRDLVGKRRCYWAHGSGYVAIYNGRARQFTWYRWTPAGYAYTGSTLKALGAAKMRLTD